MVFYLTENYFFLRRQMLRGAEFLINYQLFNCFFTEMVESFGLQFEGSGIESDDIFFGVVGEQDKYETQGDNNCKH